MGPGTRLQGWALAHTPGRGQVVFVAGVLASLRVLLPVPFVTGKCEVPWWSQCGLGSPGMLAREKPARTWLEPPMCSPSLVWPVLCCVRGQRSLCAARSWRLAKERPGCGPAWCHPKLRLGCLLWPWHRLSCCSEWRWPLAEEGAAGTLTLGLAA